MVGRMRWTTPKPIKWVVETEHNHVTILRLSTLNEIFFIKSMFGTVFDVEKSWTSRIIRERSSGDTEDRPSITMVLLATGAPDSMNFRTMGYVKFPPHSEQVARYGIGGASGSFGVTGGQGYDWK